ncbi:MAG TPA: biopolymer transporter ExbD [Gemmatimonadales bacterium]|jgi:biopolymer transport protein ExbD|nr:biopolymer transporter ExbD [Gemmatimonadales bacterium]
MAGGGSTAPGEVNHEPNVVPMIDIMLVMLIIFMVSQPLARMAMDVQVPPPETASKTQASSNQIVLELTADGGYAINTQPVPKDQLDTQLHAIFDPRPAKLMFVKSAPDRTYQEVIEAMDIARGAGVQVIGFTPAQ